MTTCDDSCAPVSGCGGTWYRNRCEGLLGLGLQQFFEPAGCGEVYALRFNSKTDMLFAYGQSAATFNVYRTPIMVGAAPGPWSCIALDLTSAEYTMVETPAPGEVWAILVTQTIGGVEGSMGWGDAGCAERINPTPCAP